MIIVMAFFPQHSLDFQSHLHRLKNFNRDLMFHFFKAHEKNINTRLDPTARVIQQADRMLQERTNYVKACERFE